MKKKYISLILCFMLIYSNFLILEEKGVITSIENENYYIDTYFWKCLNNEQRVKITFFCVIEYKERNNGIVDKKICLYDNRTLSLLSTYDERIGVKLY